MDRISVLVVDDHPLVRDGLRSRLSNDTVEVVGEAGDGQTAIAMAEELKPDIVLMDINMPVMNGIDATEMLQDKFPDIKILVLSMHDDREYVMSVLQSGARGYVLKTASSDEMFSAIQAVHNGGIYYSPDISEIILNQESRNNHSLTSREQTLMAMLASGMSNKEMANELNISVRTIETHRRNIKQKLEISTTSGLIRYAIDYGLTD